MNKDMRLESPKMMSEYQMVEHMLYYINSLLSLQNIYLSDKIQYK